MSEIFDIFDDNNNPTGETATREECHDPDKRLIHRDIHILIRREDNKIYLKKRSEYQDLYPGYRETSVTGHVESGESYDDAAYRELREETGIEGVSLDKIVDFKNFSNIERQWSRLYICRYDGPIQLNDESVEGRYFSIDEVKKALVKEKFSPGLRLALEEYIKYTNA